MCEEHCVVKIMFMVNTHHVSGLDRKQITIIIMWFITFVFKIYY